MPEVPAIPTDLMVDVFASACPSRATFEDVTSKWSSLVLLALSEQPRRFGELRRKVQGVSEKMLSQSLRLLERDGMVTRTSYATPQPRVDYALTDLGAEVALTMRSLADLLEASVPRVTAAREAYDGRDAGVGSAGAV